MHFIRPLSTFFPPCVQVMLVWWWYKCCCFDANLFLIINHTFLIAAYFFVILTSFLYFSLLRYQKDGIWCATHSYTHPPPFWLLNGDQIANTFPCPPEPKAVQGTQHWAQGTKHPALSYDPLGVSATNYPSPYCCPTTSTHGYAVYKKLDSQNH